MRHGWLRLTFIALLLAGCGAQTTPTPTAQPTPAMFTCGSGTVTWDGASAIDLTGAWAGDDDGVYYLRQIGDQVWWLGLSGRGGPLVSQGRDWANVYVGTLAGLTITGNYADVPHGGILDNGPVVMKLTPTAGSGISLVRVTPDSETGFGGRVFTPCTPG